MERIKLYRIDEFFENDSRMAFADWNLAVAYLTRLMNDNIEKVTDAVQYNFNISDGQISDKALETIVRIIIADLPNWKIEDVANFFERYLTIDDEELITESVEPSFIIIES